MWYLVRSLLCTSCSLDKADGVGRPIEGGGPPKGFPYISTAFGGLSGRKIPCNQLQGEGASWSTKAGAKGFLGRPLGDYLTGLAVWSIYLDWEVEACKLDSGVYWSVY